MVEMEANEVNAVHVVVGPAAAAMNGDRHSAGLKQVVCQFGGWPLVRKSTAVYCIPLPMVRMRRDDQFDTTTSRATYVEQIRQPARQTLSSHFSPSCATGRFYPLPAFRPARRCLCVVPAPLFSFLTPFNMPNYSFRTYSNYTNSSLFKLGLAAAGFLAGALVGAWAPELVFSRPAATSHGAPGGPAEETEDEAPLCVGPECDTMPPPKLPTTAIPLVTPSPYHVARLTAFRDAAASSRDTSELERYALLTHYMQLHSVPHQPAAVNEQLTTLTAAAAFTSRFSLSRSTDLSLSRLRQLTSQGSLALCRMQVAGEARWVAVIAVDAFYVYTVDNYTADAVCYVSARDFSKAWWALDEAGTTQTGEAWVVAAKASATQSTAGDQKGALQSRQLKPLQLANPPAAQTHVVEIASL